MTQTVFSKFELRKGVTPSLAAKSAVEAMYVAIATNFFVADETQKEIL
jgi:hypothetical protein